MEGETPSLSESGFTGFMDFQDYIRFFRENSPLCFPLKYSEW